MIQAYKTLRYFIYMNVKAQYRSEGYRLARKLMDEALVIGIERGKLAERLKGREAEIDLADAGIPAFDEGLDSRGKV